MPNHKKQTMQVELDKADLLKLVSTVKVFESELQEFQYRGWIIFTGNQWGPDFEWNHAYLNSLTEAELWEVYLRYKK